MSNKTYLMHHGIKGQKWGEENGPPYPLNPFKDYTAIERKLNHLYDKADKVINNSDRLRINDDYEDLKTKVLRNRKLPFGAASTVAAKEVMDRKISQQLEKIQNKMVSLTKDSFDNDTKFNIDLYVDKIDDLIKSFEKTKLSPELADQGSKLMDKQFMSQFLFGLPGGIITESFNDKNQRMRNLILDDAIRNNIIREDELQKLLQNLT